MPASEHAAPSSRGPNPPDDEGDGDDAVGHSQRGQAKAAWKNTLALSSCGSGLLALFAYLLGEFVPEESEGYLLVGFVAVLWTVCAYSAVRRLHPLNLLAMAAGLTWGFLIVLSIAISIQNWRVSVSCFFIRSSKDQGKTHNTTGHHNTNGKLERFFLPPSYVHARRQERQTEREF